MSAAGSVTHWLRKFQEGDQEGAEKLWQLYHRRLLALARKKLQGRLPVAGEEEDVVQSAMKSFFLGAERGQFPRLSDRDDLWQLLVVITARKAVDVLARQARVKRGGNIRDKLLAPGSPENDEQLAAVIGTEPTAEFAAQVAEEFQRLLGLLEKDEIRQVALFKMEGYTNEEIAGKLGCVERTVERRLELIRKQWGKSGVSEIV